MLLENKNAVIYGGGGRSGNGNCCVDVLVGENRDVDTGAADLAQQLHRRPRALGRDGTLVDDFVVSRALHVRKRPLPGAHLGARTGPADRRRGRAGAG